jgi:hypothetical protein
MVSNKLQLVSGAQHETKIGEAGPALRHRPHSDYAESHYYVGPEEYEVSMDCVNLGILITNKRCSE